MVNPYREKMVEIHKIVRKATLEHIADHEITEETLSQGSFAAMNPVIASRDLLFDEEITTAIQHLVENNNE